MDVEDSNAAVGIYDFLKQRGLRFPRELVTTYLLSLKTKPFVILSGISGTGKTKLAQAVAQWAGVEEPGFEAEEPVARSDLMVGRWAERPDECGGRRGPVRPARRLR